MSRQRELSSKQQAFVNAYVVSDNAYEAARSAGYAPTTAKATSYKMLENIGIQQAITRRKLELASTTEKIAVSPEWVTSRLALEAAGQAADTTQSARVSALKTLADILGMANTGTQLPDALGVLLAGIRTGQQLAEGRQQAIPVHSLPLSAQDGEQEADQEDNTRGESQEGETPGTP